MKNRLTYNKIVSLQKEYNVTGTQKSINNGTCWKMEGSVGRFASNMLDAGVCMLPLHGRYDYYGNYVPSRKEVKAGTKGSFQNSQNFWQRVIDGDYNLICDLEEMFG